MRFGLRRRVRDGGTHRADPPERCDVPAQYVPAQYVPAQYVPAQYEPAQYPTGQYTPVPHLFVTLSATSEPVPEPVAESSPVPVPVPVVRRPMRAAEALAELSALSRT